MTGSVNEVVRLMSFSSPYSEDPNLMCFVNEGTTVVSERERHKRLHSVVDLSDVL